MAWSIVGVSTYAEVASGDITLFVIGSWALFAAAAAALVWAWCSLRGII